jgi:redox-sensitive bicupin YhaK (pirin superfamily)
MSNLAASPEFEAVEASVAHSVLLNPRLVELTPRSGISIRRTLPHREIRLIGAWCFVDHYGPTNQSQAMKVATHPHTGLQTVTWLFSGEVEHRDSVGSVQQIKPGELNIMTAGFGISHAELSVDSTEDLHGIQLWVALPNQHRFIQPSFSHHNDLPISQTENTRTQVFIGRLAGLTAPTKSYSPLVGAEILFLKQGQEILELNSKFEYGFLLVEGQARVNGEEIPAGSLLALSVGNSFAELDCTKDSRLILLGGEPFLEPLVMWWNFIARTHDEILEMREDWENEVGRFTNFRDQFDGKIPAPPLPNLKLRPRS